ncbi:MAG: ATP-binding protein [Bacteroidales bacterium]|nr:ATP-binding protein [Bacteroidales bacterium]
MSKKRLSTESKTSLPTRKIQQPEVLPDLKSLNLSKQNLEAISDIIGHTKQLSRVVKKAGIPSSSSKQPGMSVLFTGKNNSEKLSAAAYMANKLNLKLYQIDLSQVVSKYIGETEKNLDRVFDDAKESNAVLFFDEADALFGKRSEVKDSHDRYANIEISYLLQKTELYEGILILSSNFKNNVGEAFISRCYSIIHFP